MVRWWMFLVLLSQTGRLWSAEPAKADPLLVDLRQALQQLMTVYYPGEPVAVTLDGNSLEVRYHTRPYQVYSIAKTGEISAELHTEQGPAADGVLLVIRVNAGPYRGAAVLPQEFVRPYWRAYGQAHSLPDRTAHLWYSLSFGARTKPEVLTVIKACLADFALPRTLPAAQLEKRNTLLKQADVELRAGLLELAKEYPALHTTNSGPLADAVKQSSPAGKLALFIGHAASLKGQELDTPVPLARQFTLLAYLQQHAPADKWLPPVQQMAIFSMYPHLCLGGQVNTTAGDPKLQAALQALLDRVLAPLAAFEGEMAKAGGTAGQ